jgi:mannosyltransferase OCH1-like enzyme
MGTTTAVGAVVTSAILLAVGVCLLAAVTAGMTRSGTAPVGRMVTFPQFLQESTAAVEPLPGPVPAVARSEDVPRIIWRSAPFDRRRLPAPLARAARSAAVFAPDFVQVFADDAAVNSFVARWFPEFLDVHRSLVCWAMRVHLWRLLVLHKFGGVYLGPGVVLLQPLHTWLPPQGLTMLAAAGGQLRQTLLAAPPGHPALLQLARALAANVRQARTAAVGRVPPTVASITGHTAVAKTLADLERTPWTVSTVAEWHPQAGALLEARTPGTDRALYTARGVPLPAGTRRLFQTPPTFLTYDQFLAWWAEPAGPAAQDRDASELPDGRLPRLLWRTAAFEAPDLPDGVLNAMATWTQHAPQWTQVYMSDADCRRFVAATQPPAVLAAYDALLPGAFRADLWRLLALHTYGGLYSDIGHVLLRPLEPALDPALDTLVLVPDRKDRINGNVARIYNAMMAARPGDPIVAAMIAFVVARITRRTRGMDCLDITGPTALGRVFTWLVGLPLTAHYPPGRHQYVLVGTKKPVQVSFARNADCLFLGSAAPGDGQALIRTKFPNYRAVIYPPSRLPHYGDLWRQGASYVEARASRKYLPLLPAPPPAAQTPAP